MYVELSGSVSCYVYRNLLLKNMGVNRVHINGAYCFSNIVKRHVAHFFGELKKFLKMIQSQNIEGMRDILVKSDSKTKSPTGYFPNKD